LFKKLNKIKIQKRKLREQQNNVKWTLFKPVESSLKDSNNIKQFQNLLKVMKSQNNNNKAQNWTIKNNFQENDKFCFDETKLFFDSLFNVMNNRADEDHNDDKKYD